MLWINKYSTGRFSERGRGGGSSKGSIEISEKRVLLWENRGVWGGVVQVEQVE